MLRTDLPEIITETLPGPKAQAIIDRREAVNPSAIKCVYPVVIEKGEGAMIQDVDGNKFLDWIGGVGVLNIGFSQPEVVEAVKVQAEKYFHGMYNVVTHEGYVALSEKLTQIAPVKGNKKKVFFANSGAEADENAVKIAKAFTKRPNIIVFSGAFHGRTLMTMSMTSKKAYAVGMGSFPDGVYRAQFPYYYRNPEGMPQEAALDYYLNSIKDVFEQCGPADSIAAIVVQPLQGEGGFIPAPIEWVKAVRKICDENGILLVADEVQTGFCRTGRMFATQYWEEAGVQPDILATAKSIAAALKTIEIMERDDLAGRSCEIGEKVSKRFNEWKEKYPVIGDVRGLGGMIGLEFVKDQKSKEPYPEFSAAVISGCAKKGLMIEGAGTYGNVIRFLAPLVMTDEQLEAGLDIYESVIKELLEK
ncbi:aspartate aminotransferase family protein [Anaerostipes hadrus]|uniref:aspartate aminotransferase family protein n=1 Tax=Anaerostipes hadrus TaxID=649756 RepID=UPI001ADDB256|nr:aspartate aminotransferase family protein [Anaerostipes hadrus]MBP0073537.1 aspartate aminotransferase family protein [Anaerostipes hadrus]